MTAVRRVLALTGALIMLMSLAAPAFAAGHKGPGALCADLYETRLNEVPPGSGNFVDFPAYWVPIEYPFGVEDLPILSPGGCASTIAAGGGELPLAPAALSTSAIVAQCKFLESTGIDYPYNFYGNPDYLAKTRADCVDFLRAFHLGELPPGPGGGE